MIMLLFTVLLSLAAPAAAQNTLQLPDVTLFGEYTLYLAAPAPLSQEIPAAMGMSDSRLSYPRSLFKVDLAEPDPPLVYWQGIPRSVLAPPGLLPDSAADDARQYTGEGQPVASSSWQAQVDYIPGKTVVSEFTTIRSSGIWDLSAELHFDLADGWVASPPSSPTDLTFAVQTRRRTEALNIDAASGVGIFYSADASAVYTLGLVAGLYGEAGAFQWREETRGVGISGIGGSPDTGRGAVQQDIRLALVGSRFDLSVRAAGILAAGFPSLDAEKHGCLAFELGWRHRESILQMWAGAAALYHDNSLIFYPSGGIDIYPTESLSILLRAAPFIRLPAEWEFHVAWIDSGLEQLEAEEGYSLLSELRFDPFAALAAGVSFEWRKGRYYFLDAADPGLSFAESNQGRLEGNLIWQIRPGGPGIRLNLTGQLAFPFPVTDRLWQDLLYKNAGLVWTTDFHKLPVEFIIKALIGDYADDGSQPFLFTNWEIVSGLITSIEGSWKIGKHGAVHTGFEAFVSPNFSFRFLIGYGIRR